MIHKKGMYIPVNDQHAVDFARDSLHFLDPVIYGHHIDSRIHPVSTVWVRERSSNRVTATLVVHARDGVLRKVG